MRITAVLACRNEEPFIQAWLEEAAAYVARGHRDIIAELTGCTFSELTFTGGAAKGTLWPQVIADVLGLPVHVPAVT